MEQWTQPQRLEPKNETNEEKDKEGLMEAVAHAMSQAERDKQASQAARVARGATREDAMMQDGQNGRLTGDARIFLQEDLVQAAGTNQETPEDSRRRKGKAPVDEEAARTPEAVK